MTRFSDKCLLFLAKSSWESLQEISNLSHLLGNNEKSPMNIYISGWALRLKYKDDSLQNLLQYQYYKNYQQYRIISRADKIRHIFIQTLRTIKVTKNFNLKIWSLSNWIQRKASRLKDFTSILRGFYLLENSTNS